MSNLILPSSATLPEFPAPTDLSSEQADIADLEAHFASYGPIVRYLGLSKPGGYAPAYECLYQFDGTANDLTDRSGNGRTLQVANGTELHVVRNGLKGFCAKVNTYLNTAAVDNTLTSLGALTFEITTAFEFPTSDTDILCGVTGTPASGTEANNCCGALALQNDTANLYHFHESGAGVARIAYFGYVLGQGDMQYVVLTRAADGVTYDLYVNGVLCAQSVAAAAPTGGTTNVRLWIGGWDTASDYYGDIFSLRYSKGYMTAAQVAEVNETLRAV